MKERTYNLLGLYPNGVTLCHSNERKDSVVVIEPISEKEEQRIDNAPKYYGEIRHVKSNGKIIAAKDIYLYGEVDFKDHNDIRNISKFNLIDKDLGAANWIYSNFNFDKGNFTTIDGVAKGSPTWDAVQWFMYNYVLIGKPQRIIVYKKQISKYK